jgi:hypothetical protein
MGNQLENGGRTKIAVKALCKSGIFEDNARSAYVKRIGIQDNQLGRN